jgi:hypothetical protein
LSRAWPTAKHRGRRGRTVARDPARRQSEQHGADLEQVLQLAPLELGHLGAALGNDRHQAALLEQAKGLAHGGAADAEAAREVDFLQPLARRDLLLDDGRSEAVGKLQRQRARQGVGERGSLHGRGCYTQWP